MQLTQPAKGVVHAARLSPATRQATRSDRDRLTMTETARLWRYARSDQDVVGVIGCVDALDEGIAANEELLR